MQRYRRTDSVQNTDGVHDCRWNCDDHTAIHISSDTIVSKPSGRIPRNHVQLYCTEPSGFDGHSASVQQKYHTRIGLLRPFTAGDHHVNVFGWLKCLTRRFQCERWTVAASVSSAGLFARESLPLRFHSLLQRGKNPLDHKPHLYTFPKARCERLRISD